MIEKGIIEYIVYIWEYNSDPITKRKPLEERFLSGSLLSFLNFSIKLFVLFNSILWFHNYAR